MSYNLSSTTATQYRLQQYFGKHTLSKNYTTPAELESIMLEPEQAEKILIERARELANSIQSPYTDFNKSMLVILNQEYCRIGINILEVKAIIPLDSLTVVPGVPTHIAGITYIRGKILTLVNIEKFIQKKISSHPEKYDGDYTVVLIEISGMEFGLLSYGDPIITPYNPDNFTRVGGLILDYQNEYVSGIDQEGVIKIELATITNSSAFTVNQS